MPTPAHTWGGDGYQENPLRPLRPVVVGGVGRPAAPAPVVRGDAGREGRWSRVAGTGFVDQGQWVHGPRRQVVRVATVSEDLMDQKKDLLVEVTPGDWEAVIAAFAELRERVERLERKTSPRTMGMTGDGCV